MGAIAAEFGRIDILHNNAGVTVRKSIDRLEEREWDFVLDVGLKGLFLMSKHVIPELRKVCGEDRPLVRIGQPENIAKDVLFLCSDLAGWVTGAALKLGFDPEVYNCEGKTSARDTVAAA